MRLALVLAALAAVLAAVPPTPAAARRDCATAGVTIAANARARVFQRTDKEGLRVSYACLLPRGRVYRLSRHDDVNASETLGRLTLAGRHVGFARSGCDGPFGEYCATQVKVRDLRTGKVVRAAKAYEALSYSFEVSDLALAPNGDVAWISFSEDPDYPTDVREVRAATSARGSVLLDSGADVGPRSLAMAGRRVYWIRAGEPRSALLR
jgi:hypothetical protein